MSVYKLVIFCLLIQQIRGEEKKTSPGKASNTSSSLNTTSINYLGCYNDDGNEYQQLYTFREELGNNSTPSNCSNICLTKSYAFAYLRNENECFCGIGEPSFTLRLNETECNSHCTGDTSLYCGSKVVTDNEYPLVRWRVSAYRTGLDAPRKSKAKDDIEDYYFGCFNSVDDEANRLLNDSFLKLPGLLSPHNCLGSCYSLGYLYAGLENGNLCVCGDDHPAVDPLLSSQCDISCPGNNNQTCGGKKKIEIYSTSITDYTDDGKYLGCYKSDDPILHGERIFLLKTNTPRRCINLCNMNKFQFAALTNFTDCWCGNNTIPFDYTQDRYCMKGCPGGSSIYCGNNGYLAVHKTYIGIYTGGTSNGITNNVDCSVTQSCPEHRGCYTRGNQFKGFREGPITNLTPNKCIDLCISKGFIYAATGDGHNCLCDNNKPSNISKACNKDCNIPCTGKPTHTCGGELAADVYDTGIKSPRKDLKDKYLGCFEDKAYPKGTLKKKLKFIELPSSDDCVTDCLLRGYKLAAFNLVKDCFCDDKNPLNESKVNDTKCERLCTGNETNDCGTNSDLKIVKTGLDVDKDKYIKGDYLGCFDADSEEIKMKINMLERINTPQLCGGICKTLGFRFAALRNGTRCFCGYFIPSLSSKVSDEKCNLPCMGKKELKICGGNQERAVYKLYDDDITTETSPTARKQNQHKIGSDCGLSVSTVKGMVSKPHKVVFEEKFDDRLDTDIWHRTVRISDSPDEHFVVYSDAEEVSFTEDGILNIDTHLFPKTYVKGGSLVLRDCNGKRNTTECSLKATGNNILPPIKTAELSTINSFYFRYGIVEIIAKFPEGDWIIPELYLEPKYQVHGRNFKSGRIIIAMVLGNANLTTKEGKQIGSTCLKYGFTLANNSRIVTRESINCIKESWSEDFHNYTFIWTPNDLKLMVDGNYQNNIMAGINSMNLCQTTGLDDLCANTLKSESNIAPFDQDFYLKVGVTAGGNRIFPDDSITNFNKKKPWINNETDMIKHFWDKIDDWQPTWKSTALKIKSIKVTTL